MAYRFRYYTPFKKQEKKARRAMLKKHARRALLCVGAVLLVLSIVVSVSEYVDGPLPTWKEIYDAVGIIRLPRLPEEAQGAATKIHFINVGQADATLIEQNGEFCLIDAGDVDSAEILLTYLDRMGVERLKLLVMTHGHLDHVGSMPQVLEHVEVDAALLPTFTDINTSGYTLIRTLELLDTLGVPCYTAREGDTYAIGDGVLKVLGDGVNDSPEENNRSLITRFTARGVRFLSCGDAENAATGALLERGISLRANLYKAAHHGAANAANITLLKAIQPDYVIVSCGADNSFGHPQITALNAFDKVNATVYRTDENGNIVAFVDEHGKLRIAPELTEEEY